MATKETPTSELVDYEGTPMLQLIKTDGRTWKFGKKKAESIIHNLPAIIDFAKNQGVDMSEVPTLTKTKAKAKK